MSLGSIKDYTPNYKFIIPEFDIATWHDYIEANFRSIDALLYNIFVINGYSGQWTNATLYRVNQVLFIGEGNDDFTGKLFKVKVQHTTPSTGNFKTYYTSHPTYYEQFADFDAAERAAQLAKDWANKTNGKVDGIEYSSKYYAQLAQQTVNNKANNNEVVHLSGAETITGEKTFTSRINYSGTLGAPIRMILTDYDMSVTTNNSNHYLGFHDKNNNFMGGIQSKYVSGGNSVTKLMVRKQGDTTTADSSLPYIGIYYSNDIVRTYAPTPTENTSTSTQIDTVGARVTACNSLSTSISNLSTDCMKLSGNQTINGIKYFKDNIITNIDAVRGVEPDENKFGGLGIHDNNNNMFMSLLGSMDTNKNASVFLRVFNPNNTSTNAANSTYLTLYYKADGKKYVTCSSNDEPNAVLTTISSSKRNSGYFELGNGLIVQWGKVASGGNAYVTITYPKAFSSASSYSISATQRSRSSSLASSSAVSIYNPTATTIQIASRAINESSDNDYFYWVAIGH